MSFRKYKINTTWTPELAYVIGLITTDGNLTIDGRHISYTSKDFQLAQTFKDLLRIQNVIGKKQRGGSLIKKYFVVQFGDVNFYEFLTHIGLMPKKSKSLAALKIPNNYFRDFLRGCIDGDGSFCASYFAFITTTA